jgi:hypothetical protein
MPTIDWRIAGAMHHEEMINIMTGCYGKVILLAIDYKVGLRNKKRITSIFKKAFKSLRR